MPEEGKKETEKKGKGLASNGEAFVQIGIMLIILAVLSSLYERLFGNGSAAFLASPFMQAVLHIYSRFKVVSVYVSVLLFIAVFYLVSHINEIRTEERKLLYPETPEEEKGKIINRKWQRVVDHLESNVMSDWKLAIIEADIILNDLLEAMGYHGDTVGEKLKQVERSDFITIDKAWEAHKVRNLIAHEGSDFVLTKKEAVRVVELYKEVFEEFFFI